MEKMIERIINIQVLEWFTRNKGGIVILLLALSLAANYFLYVKYEEMVEKSIDFERERVRNFDEITKRLIDKIGESNEEKH